VPPGGPSAEPLPGPDVSSFGNELPRFAPPGAGPFPGAPVDGELEPPDAFEPPERPAAPAPPGRPDSLAVAGAQPPEPAPAAEACAEAETPPIPVLPVALVCPEALAEVSPAGAAGWVPRFAPELATPVGPAAPDALMLPGPAPLCDGAPAVTPAASPARPLPSPVEPLLEADADVRGTVSPTPEPTDGSHAGTVANPAGGGVTMPDGNVALDRLGPGTMSSGTVWGTTAGNRCAGAAPRTRVAVGAGRASAVTATCQDGRMEKNGVPGATAMSDAATRNAGGAAESLATESPPPSPR